MANDAHIKLSVLVAQADVMYNVQQSVTGIIVQINGCHKGLTRTHFIHCVNVKNNCLELC